MSQPATDPIGATPMPLRGPAMLGIVVAVVFALLLWLTVAFQVLLVVPRFERISRDFHLRLPWMAERVIHDTWWVASACLFLCFSRAWHSAPGGWGSLSWSWRRS
ncbi:MAG: hypothetical protein HYX68_20420 [Planctomycetes bacterium]|nr:hypothetical protein [Planctomycetota bacterium]